MTDITCVSPVNGRVYVTRPAAPIAEVRERLARARTAQKTWARVPLEERIAGYSRVSGGWKA